MVELWNVGSVSTHVGNLVGWTSITSLSGATLDNIVKQNVRFVEQYVSTDIDETAIPEKYQPPIVKLSQADVLLARESQQDGLKSVHLGELTVSQDTGTNADLAKQLREEALTRLSELQRKVRFTRILGC